MLSSAAAVVSEFGYGRMSVARVTGGARVSRRTFYDVFEDREDCFLAVFEDALAQVAELVIPAYAGEQDWHERARAALAVLLGLLDEEPGMCSLLIVDALSAGPRVLEHRAEVLKQLGEILRRGVAQSKAASELPPLTGEGVVGAVFSVIHTRALAKPRGRMLDLLNPLMGMIVLPYLGPQAARRELERPAPTSARAIRAGAPGVRGSRGRSSNAPGAPAAGSPLDGLPMRLTYRTLRVLSAIAECPAASNRTVAARAEIADQGQISKLLARLERLGLVQNTGEGQSNGEPNAWRLTPRGEEVERTVRVQPGDADLQASGKSERSR
jgi:AcrR family transcriptional regulator/DNA-binding MarR family transcriptional regulator